MTGFGAAEGRVGAARVAVEVRSVNHRFFSPTIKLPAAFARWEGDVREALRQKVTRGHVTLFARAEREAGAAGTIDEVKFAAYVEQLRVLQRRHGLPGDVDVATVLRMPEIFAAPDADEGGSAAELVSVVEAALAALLAMRAEEGARLVALLRDRIDLVEKRVDAIAGRAPARLVEQRDRLRTAVAELAAGVAVDDGRLAQEVAILADRLDVSEELDRFRSHLAAFREALADRSAESVGKRLGFLLQELLREANTTGSKANDAAMLRDVVQIKEELERIREQVENLE
ncbi:MAG TPA: YicC/YloC family endoribonuclease [Gemmatimonadaceae bacterium]|nr:YicC/YloC family endoribonuclease [Gemmatimonadaceae bacterium]